MLKIGCDHCGSTNLPTVKEKDSKCINYSVCLPCQKVGLRETGVWYEGEHVQPPAPEKCKSRKCSNFSVFPHFNYCSLKCCRHEEHHRYRDRKQGIIEED